jgi:hypothetical protein
MRNGLRTTPTPLPRPASGKPETPRAFGISSVSQGNTTVQTDPTLAARFEAIRQIHQFVETVEGAVTVGAYQHALKAAESLVATLRPLVPSAAD